MNQIVPLFDLSRSLPDLRLYHYQVFACLMIETAYDVEMDFVVRRHMQHVREYPILLKAYQDALVVLEEEDEKVVTG